MCSPQDVAYGQPSTSTSASIQEGIRVCTPARVCAEGLQLPSDHTLNNMEIF